MKNKKIFLVLLFLTCCLSACKTKEKALLWEISGNGLTKPSYLFGTNHEQIGINLDDFLSSVPGFDKSIASVELLAIEADSDNNRLVMANALGNPYMPQNISYGLLRDLNVLNENDFNLLDSISNARLGVRADDLKLSPNYLALDLLMSTPKEEKDSAKIEQPQLDFYLKEIASRKRINRVVGLDSEMIRSDVYIGKLNMVGMNVSTSWEEGVTSLMKMINNFTKIDTTTQDTPELISLKKELKLTVDQMNYAYFKELDLLALAKHKERQLKVISQMQHLMPKGLYIEGSIDLYFNFLLHKRNEVWMQKIPSIISEQPSFIAVGAMHLVDFDGQSGLIRRLRNLGYIVKPIKDK